MFTVAGPVIVFGPLASAIYGVVLCLLRWASFARHPLDAGFPLAPKTGGCIMEVSKKEDASWKSHRTC